MPSPETTIATYLRQLRFRTLWFLLSLVVGVVTAVVVTYTESAFPAWDAGLLATGLVFFPVFIWQVNRKGFVSTREAWRARDRLTD